VDLVLETILASGLSYSFCAVAVTDVVLIVVVVVEMTACGLSSYCYSVAATDLETTVADAVADATTDVSRIIPLKSFCLYRQKLFIFKPFHSYILLTASFGRIHDSF
jgi:hypothetical protein